MPDVTVLRVEKGDLEEALQPVPKKPDPRWIRLRNAASFPFRALWGLLKSLWMLIRAKHAKK